MGAKKITSRQIQAQKTKEKLIKAGTELIKSTSYDEILIDDITKKCGVSRGTFYVHFKSKDQFFYSICHADYSNLKCILEDETEPLFLERLRTYCKEWILINDSMSMYYMQNWFSHILDTEYHIEVAGTSNPYREFKDEIKSCIESAQANGEIAKTAPIDDLANYTLLQLYGFDIFSVISKQSTPVSKWSGLLADTIVDTIIGAYRMSK